MDIAPIATRTGGGGVLLWSLAVAIVTIDHASLATQGGGGIYQRTDRRTRQRLLLLCIFTHVFKTRPSHGLVTPGTTVAIWQTQSGRGLVL